MDLLSEVLRVVKLEGALFFNAEFSSPWCLRNSGAAGIKQQIPAEGQHLILYHFVAEGRAYARLEGGRRELLNAGDIIVFPHGDPHFLGNGSARAIDSLKTFSQGLRLVRFGGGGEVTRFVCGYMACEPLLSEMFLAGLPAMLKVHVTGEPSGEWLANSIRFSVGEDEDSEAGSGLVHAKLAELLFVETLRRYINSLPPDQTGWLGGARDPMVCKALALLHTQPEYPWSVLELARHVGLSRTRLAERFRHFLGDSPMAYLAQWRLKLGAEILQTTDDSVAEVAAAVGYGSEATFNRAFKRAFDCPPAQFRRQHRER